MSAEDWEPFKALRKERQEKRAKARLDFEEHVVAEALEGWTKHHETHWSTTLLGDRLDYWPGPKKWRWRNNTNTGDVFAFIRAREDAAD